MNEIAELETPATDVGFVEEVRTRVRNMRQHRWAVVITVGISELPTEFEAAFGSVTVSLRDNPTTVSPLVCYDCGVAASSAGAGDPCPAEPRLRYPEWGNPDVVGIQDEDDHT